jgi:rhamnose utilization protein RhaD (predicted bifunctional aldolase and dehydrogenase)
MQKDEQILMNLVEMSLNLGRPEMDYIILGEGNSSAKIDAETFWVKASGASLSNLEPENLIKVNFEKTLALLEQENLSDDEIRAGLKAVCVDPLVKSLPSVETFLHAVLLQFEGVNYIGHTHPTAINAILCSKKASEAYSGSLFPDQIVYCGAEAVFIPYTDPGFILARTVREHVQDFYNRWRKAPKMILMQNHGFIALGETAKDVENITAMAVKSARIIAGSYAMGGPNFLSPESVDRIDTRPDEAYRRQVWGTR